MAAWDNIPENERPFQRRLMEVLPDSPSTWMSKSARSWMSSNVSATPKTRSIFYIWGDNGSSAEGQNGTISELIAQNGIPSTVAQHIAALEELGGLDVLGLAEDRQSIPLRLGLGRQHAVQGHEIARFALWRHPQPDGSPVARRRSSRTRLRGLSFITATTLFRRSTKSSASRRPSKLMAFSRTRLTA